MTGKRGATPYPLPTLCTIRVRKITTAVTVAPKHSCILKLLLPKQYLRQNPTPRVIPCRVRAPGAWNHPAVATTSACCGVCARTRRFPDRSQGMTWKRGATPHQLPTLCTIRARKITIAVAVAPTHNPTPSVIPCKVRAPCMEVGSIKVEVGSRKMHIAPVHGAGIAALLLFRASLHSSFFMLLTSFGDSPTVVRE